MMNANQRMPKPKRKAVGRFAACLSCLSMLSLPVSAQADVRESVKRALPATVGIEWRDKTGQSPNHINLASGTIVSADGLIVSVIQTPQPLGYSVTLSDGRVFDARLLVVDRRSKLKLLKIDATDLPFLAPFHEPVQIGEDVTMTACEDLKNRVAVRGIVAAKDKDLEGLGSDLLQLDMTVQPMSGGAPLVDEQGRLRGIMAFLRIGKPISFAATDTHIQALLDAPRGDSPTTIHRGRLGVILKEINQDGRKVVAHPIERLPASEAGLKEGDLILEFNGQKVASQKELQRLTNRKAAGDDVRLKINRDGQDQELVIKLAAVPEEFEQERPPVAPQAPAPPAVPGVPAAPLTPAAPAVSGKSDDKLNLNFEPVATVTNSEASGSAKGSSWKLVQPAQILIIDKEQVVHTVSGDAAVQMMETLRKSDASGTVRSHTARTRIKGNSADVQKQQAGSGSASGSGSGSGTVITRPVPDTTESGQSNEAQAPGSIDTPATLTVDATNSPKTSKPAEVQKTIAIPVQKYAPVVIQKHVVPYAIPSIQVERTNLEKKLEKMNREMLSLQETVKKLNEKIEQLTANPKATPEATPKAE